MICTRGKAEGTYRQTLAILSALFGRGNVYVISNMKMSVLTPKQKAKAPIRHFILKCLRRSVQSTYWGMSIASLNARHALFERISSLTKYHDVTLMPI
jgi:hypothetical protein